jgi:heptosyltransferase-2
MAFEILIVKTGALGDVLRTTSILPGLSRKHPRARVHWLTATGAVDLVRLHPLVAEVSAVDPKNAADVASMAERLAKLPRDWLISLDDEEPLCRLAARVPARRLSGAFARPDGQRAYSADVAPWFDMGLLSVHGKQRADELKLANRKSHPRIYAEMLGIEMGAPELPGEPAAEGRAKAFAERTGLRERGPVLGLNTGAGGRWTSKTLSPARTAAIARHLDRVLAGGLTFLLLGGRDEAARNQRILELVGPKPRLIDGGTENSLMEFAGLVGLCDCLLTSDSLALHVALARCVRCVAFFAPTSAAEIELYGLGEKVASTAPDACSYRPDADTSTLTIERLCAALLRQLSRGGPTRVKIP